LQRKKQETKATAAGLQLICESVSKNRSRINVTPALSWVPEAVVSNAAIPSYLEIVDFIASGTTPQAVADYRPSLEAQRRIAELIAQEKEGSLSVEEKSELDHFMDLEHILRVAKARARQILASGS
jgi:hypothetical protein